MFQRAIISVFVLLISLAVGTAQASSVIPPRHLGELAVTSEAVVLARAGVGDAERTGRLILTETPFEVLDVVRGPMAVGARLSVATYGGETDGYGWKVGGSPQFEAGAVYLLFLHQDAQGTWRPQMLSYGLLRRVEGTDGSVLLTHLEEAHDLNVLKRPDGTDAEPIGTYYEADLLQHLQRVVTGTARWDRATADAAPSLLPATVHGAADKQAQAIPDPCVFITDSQNGQPVRWDVPAGSGPVDVYAEASGDDDLGGDGPSFVQTGVSQWTSISGIDLNWAYAGTQTYTPSCSGGSAINTFPQDFNSNEALVQFNDPCDEIDDLNNGAGVLAFGGPFYSRTLHTHRGVDWNTAGIGFVVYNNGVGAALNATQYQQVMTHELGHALGFGHIAPTDGQANMNPSCCNPVTTIDEDCALFAYSETGGGGGGGGGGTLPGAVALSVPQDGATDLATTVVFQWQAVSDATAYQLQLATDAGFTGVVRNETVAATSRTVSGLDESTTYYWRVRATNTDGDGPWSNGRSFTTTVGAPGAVALSSPQDGDSIEGESVTFQWQSLASAVSYRVQVGLDPSFNTTVFDEAGLSATSRTVSGLDESATYYWRVRAANSGGDGPWSAVRSFSTRPALPGMITLVTPDDRAVDQPQTVQLQWQVDPAAATYQVQVSLRANFSEIIAEQSGLTGTAFDVGPLEAGTTHYWRVRGANAAGDGAWSPTRRFTVAALPGAVALSEPADAATVTHTAISFQWETAPDTDTYHLQIATDADFSDLAFEQTGLTGTVRSLTSLQPGTDYVWRVRGANAFGTGDWSAARSFSTLPAIPAAVTLSAPPDDTGATSGIVRLQWQAADRADTYGVQVATDAGFGTLVVEESGLRETELDVGPLAYSTTHHWRVRASNAAGAGSWSTPRRFTTAVGTDVERMGDDVPTRLALHSNYPNPFNPRTTVRFDLPETMDVSLVVYDMLGRIVETLTSGSLSPGSYTYVWEADDLPSGSYLIQLQAGPQTQTRVAMLVK